MRKKFLAILGIILLIAAVLWIAKDKLLQPRTTTGTTETVNMHVDHKTYSNLQELIKDAEHILIVQPSPNPTVKADDYNSRMKIFMEVQSYHKAKVIKTLKGNLKGTVTISILGGEYSGKNYTYEDRVKLKTGQRYIIFATGTANNLSALAADKAIFELTNDRFDLNNSVMNKGVRFKNLHIDNVSSNK